MPKTRDEDRYLLKRGETWTYYRRVPKDLRAHYDLPFIRKALNTRSIETARKSRDGLVDADDSWWAALRVAAEAERQGLPIDLDVARKRHAAMVVHAMSMGFAYQPMEVLAQPGHFDDVVNRLITIGDHASPNGDPKERDAEALLGGASEPVVTVLNAFDIYKDEIKVQDLRTKSPKQIELWTNTKKRSIEYFVEVVSDLPMTSITRDHAITFRNYWIDRMNPKKGDEQVSWNTANRHIGDMRVLYGEYFKHMGDEDRKNPFRNLTFKDQGKKEVPAFEDDWVREKILVKGALSGARWELQIVPIVMIETGLRPGEIVNLLPSDIHLDAEVPYLSVRPRLTGKDRREIKAQSSVREVPLVGVSLEAMKQAPEGFPHYHDKGSAFSAAANKALRARGLCPTKDHVIYSFRHAFEKRMQEANIDYALRCLLMGHKHDRPKYGDGGSLAYRRDELLKIAHPVPAGLFDGFDEERRLGPRRRSSS